MGPARTPDPTLRRVLLCDERDFVAACVDDDINRETPTRIELMQQLGMVGERLSHIEARQEADRETFTRQLASVGRQLDTLNSYLHTLVETAIQRGAK